MPMAQEYFDRYWESEDGLKLHYRDYASDGKLTPLICVHGLTRNARDFAHLGPWLEGKRRVLMINVRGRGFSEYAKDSSTYNAKYYVADIIKLMDELEMKSAAFLGTSMGGIISMMTAKWHPGRVAGAMLNDIGPTMEPEGLERIGNAVGHGKSFETWVHAARDLAAESSEIHPDFSLNDWIGFAKKLYQMNSSGRIKLDYDMKVSEPFDASGSGEEALWKAVGALKNIPVTLVRGELSDLFSEATAKKMLSMLDHGELVTVPRVGHAPTLEEPAALDAITAFLQRVDQVQDRNR